MKTNKYEKDLDEMITKANEGMELTPDAMTTVLTEFNARMLSRVLTELERVNSKLDKITKLIENE